MCYETSLPAMHQQAPLFLVCVVTDSCPSWHVSAFGTRRAAAELDLPKLVCKFFPWLD